MVDVNVIGFCLSCFSVYSLVVTVDGSIDLRTRF